MTDTASAISDDASAPGEQVQVISFLATDDELLLLLQDEPGALMKLYPEGEDELSRGVMNAVKRSLIARRAAILGETDDRGRLELLQPWAGLVEHLATGGRFCRITVDGDDRTARLVMVGEDALFTVDRDPTGVNTVTISIPEFAAQVVSEPFVRVGDEAPGDAVAGRAPVRLDQGALVEGRQLLDQGAEDEAEHLLGEATDLFAAAVRTYRVETMELTGSTVHGTEFDVLDAGALGWVHVTAGDDATDVIVTSLTDDGLVDALVAALAS